MKTTAKVVVIRGGVVSSGIPGLVEPVCTEIGSSLQIEILGELLNAQ